MNTDYDVIIVGGGPAGMSAALILGRCRRKVLICDAGRPRNYAARAMHNFLTRDGISPAELRRVAREELIKYGVEICESAVTDAWSAECKTKSAPPENAESESDPNSGEGRPSAPFEITRTDGRRFTARKLLLATGVVDQLPPIEGATEFYGRGVFHCPYCDGWEFSDRTLISYGRGSAGLGLALALLTWSPDVTVCTDGTALSRSDREKLRANGLNWRREKIVRLEGRDGGLARVIFERGEPLGCDALFFNTGQVQRSSLPLRLGCGLNREGGVRIDRRGRTGIRGLFLAGDASRDVQFVITAASDGAKAAVAINRELQDEDRVGSAEKPSELEVAAEAGARESDNVKM